MTENLLLVSMTLYVGAVCVLKISGWAFLWPLRLAVFARKSPRNWRDLDLAFGREESSQRAPPFFVDGVTSVV
jgi:hypothetical protein